MKFYTDIGRNVSILNDLKNKGLVIEVSVFNNKGNFFFFYN